jgi:lysozyme
VRFVYFKVSEGSKIADSALEKNGVNARAAGLDVGTYHFLTSDSDPTSQAQHFLGLMKPYVSSLSLLPSLDVEWDPGPMRADCPPEAIIKIRKSSTEVVLRCDKWAFLSSAEIITRINQWVDIVKNATGNNVVIYTSGVWWTSRVGSRNRIGQVNGKVVWVADYSKGGLATEKPSVPVGAAWGLWQFTDGAALSFSGQRVLLDASIFNGTYESFKAQFGK